MNLFRFLSYLLIAAIAVLVLSLGSMIAAVTGGASLTPEVRRALIVLILVLLLALLILLFLLCLARAKERLRAEKQRYRDAHGDDPRKREEAEKATERQGPALQGICDVLVRRKFPRPCIQLPIDVTRRPDPCIYSQFYLMANGQPVTWDNPNVEILLAGVPQDTFNLQAATTYEVRVGIENASPFFDALNTQVQVNLLSFGMGAPGPAPLASYVENVPAATIFPGVPHVFNWTTPTPPSPDDGHYCIQVLITHPDDVNPGNNEGWNNTVVKRAQPGEAFRLSIPVWNGLFLPGREQPKDARRFSEIAITLDSYTLDVSAAPDNLEALFAPRATLWGAAASPARLVIPPGSRQSEQVQFEVTVPADAAAGTRAAFNLSATAGGRPLGGVTIYVEVE